MAKHVDHNALGTWLPHCSCALLFNQPRKLQLVTLNFAAVGALQVAKNKLKEGALTEKLERVLAEKGSEAAVEAGYQMTPMGVPLRSKRGVAAAQLQLIILAVLVATGGVYRVENHAKETSPQSLQ